MSFYAKYRPQTFAELDLFKVRDELLKILKTGEFSHAYLFAGPKGTGKTSGARILAKVLNCEKNLGAKGSLHEPCNQCVSCKGIINGSSMAVMEMDAASNRGIDDIRLLRERIGLAPAGGTYAVYVVDEVHMLTTEAFNALLKTLEEPPAHAVFVLATTEKHKLPATVVSRCTTIQFYKAGVEEVKHSLAKAVKGEKLKIDDEALEAIASRVDGSFRDGMKVLEQLSADTKDISLAMVDELTGYSDEYNPEIFLRALWKRDVRMSLDDLQKREQLGVDFNVFGKRLVEVMRNGLLKLVAENSVHVRVAGEMLEVFSKAALGVKSAVIPEVPLEVAAVEWCAKKEKNENGKNQKEIPQNEPQKESAVTQPKTTSGRDAVVDMGELQQKWPEVLNAIRSQNQSLEAILRGSRLVSCEGNRIVVEVFYSFHKEQLEQERHRMIIEKEMGEVLQGGVHLQLVLGERVSREVAQTDMVVSSIADSKVDDQLVQAAEEIFS